ncbi:hypothetical protein BH23PLA1_BH23PLA1_08790 [soil metagenome]
MKSLRITITIVLLLGGYFGYTRLFAVVADHLRQDYAARSRGDFDPSPGQSASAREASAYAKEMFGKHHWTAYSDKRYYNVERGYWMYFNEYERNPEYEGKRIEFKPFAVISRSKEDGSLKVISGDRAVVDFDKPFNLIKPGPSPSIVHARIEGINQPVEIRDNRGTSDPADDLVVTMPYVEFIEPALQIRCSQAVHLVDRDVDVTGIGLLISLRPGETGPGGFSGADSITLERNVEIRASDVGQTGLLPGTARAGQQLPGSGPEAPKTPFRLMCDGPMRLHFPMPRRPVWVGPPAPDRPTIADFSRNVILQRGAGVPDQINGDHLRAILVPSEAGTTLEVDGEELASSSPASIETGEEAPEAAPPSTGGPLQSLVLQEARVDGHAVWLQSEAQGVTVRSNELIYKKARDGEPDVTYLRADTGKQLWMERRELDNRGLLKSVMTIWTTDATIQGGPDDGEGTTVVARGPGLMEMRAAQDRPVDRSANWKDELIVHTGVPDTASAASEGEPVKTLTYVTLTGWPVIDDPEQVVMAARDKIIACLEDRPKTPGASTATSRSDSSADAYQIRWLKALGDVHMLTPESTAEGGSQPYQSLNGREQLNVVFEYPTLETEEGTTPAPGLALPSGSGRPLAQAISSEPDPEPTPRAQLAAQADADSEADEPEAAPSKPADPGIEVEADVIWARVEAVPNANGGPPRREVREVRLRGDVAFHQDPNPGDSQGLDILAKALDLTSSGPDRAWFQAYGEEEDWASVATPEFTIEGPVLGLDQTRDFAWVRGPGRLTQTSEGSLTLAGMGRPASSSDATQGGPPLLIDWDGGMLFHGVYPDERGRPGPARALFVGKVVAKMGDDRVDCEEMEAIMDRPVPFARSEGSQPLGGSREGRPQPKVAAVICREGVNLRSVDRNAETREIRELRRIVGDSVTFEKATGNYWVDKIGAVLFTTREPEAERRVDPQTGRPVESPPRKLSQTRIDFRNGMEGHFGDAPSGASRGVREARFQGDVEVTRAEVDRFDHVLDHDRQPVDATYMSAETLFVESNPAIQASNVPARDFMRATGNALAQSDGKTIQGDRITYDSLNHLFEATSSTRHPVNVASQESPGLPLSTGAGQTFQYNPRTGEARFVGPGTMQLYQPGTGGRFGPHDPAEPEVEEPEKRPEPRLPGRGSLERQGFSGW